jgi:D-3-phosphoglycerate dehydrogenase
MQRTVLLAAPVHAVLREGLGSMGYVLREALGIRQEDAPALLADCEGVVTSTRLKLDAALLDAAPGLRWIGRMGSGMEVIDQEAAAQRGVAVLSSPEGNANAVAEHALGLLLSLTKHIDRSAREVRAGEWLREENRGIELEGKTLGIIGFGHTGRAFAKKLQGMDMRLLAYDVRPQADVPSWVTIVENLEIIWNEGTIVSFHVPFAPDTHQYFNQDFAERMTQPFYLLNTSRGNVVDTSVLPQLLARGKLLGAGLDVWEEEPISRMNSAQRSLLNELSGHPDVIVTPHVAGYTHEALYKMSVVLLAKIAVLTDK